MQDSTNATYLNSFQLLSMTSSACARHIDLSWKSECYLRYSLNQTNYMVSNKEGMDTQWIVFKFTLDRRQTDTG